MDPDGEIAGDGDLDLVDAARAPKAPPGKRRFTKSPANIVAQHVATSAEDSAPNDLCIVCMKDSSDNDFVKGWRGKQLHQHCWNAVRCYLRAQRNKFQKDAEQTMFYKQFETWRRTVLPLVVFDGGARSVQARAELNVGGLELESEYTETYTETQQIKETRLMHKGHYKVHQRQWEGWQSDEASDDFEKQIGMQSGDDEDSEGNPRIRVPIGEVVRVIKGERHVRRKRGGARSVRASSVPDAAGSGSERSAHESTSKRFRTRSPGARSMSSRVMTPIGKKDTDDSLPLGASASKSTAPSSPTTTAPASLTVVGFMREKDRLKQETGNILAGARSKHALGTRLRAAMVRLTDQQRKDVVGSPDEVLQNIDGAVKKLQTFKDSLDNLQREGIAAAQAELASLVAGLEEASNAGTEIFDGIVFILEKGKTEVRQVQFQLRHKKQRTQNKLVTGGYGSNFAKDVADIMHDGVDGKMGSGNGFMTNRAIDAMQFGNIMLWDKTDEIGKAFVELFEASFVGWGGGVCLSCLGGQG